MDILSSIGACLCSDYTPIASTGKGILYLSAKIVAPCMRGHNSPFLRDVDQKSIGRCLMISVPVLGNLLVYMGDKSSIEEVEESPNRVQFLQKYREELYTSNHQRFAELIAEFKGLKAEDSPEIYNILSEVNFQRKQRTYIPVFTGTGYFSEEGVTLPPYNLQETPLTFHQSAGESEADPFLLRPELQNALEAMPKRVPRSQEEADQLVKALSTCDLLLWGYPDEGCFVREKLMTRLLTLMGIPEEAIVKQYITFDGEDNWNYHVAVRIGDWVIDPSIASTRALSLQEWIDLEIKRTPNVVKDLNSINLSKFSIPSNQIFCFTTPSNRALSSCKLSGDQNWYNIEIRTGKLLKEDFMILETIRHVKERVVLERELESS